MLNEMNDLEDNTEEEISEIVEEINYTVSTNKYRKKLIKKISIVFVSVLLIFITRFFKHAPFDIIVASSLFVFLLGVSIVMGIGILLYMYSSINALDTERENKMHKSLLNIFDLVSVIPIFMVIVSLTNIVAFSPATVVGQSMEPTFYEGQDIIMSHITNNYDQFDIIILETKDGDFYLKRIIGLPGDHIEINNSIITINGTVIDQEFLENESGSIEVNTYCNISQLQVCEFVVPLDHYFVLGDNRENSLDSRSDLLGYVHEDQIYGKVIFKFNNIFRDVLNQE
ncbi:MAG: signal peptidase I [Candidatus Izimaplasma sp.]|nr:signal peptidase I [Candidatus Izimaplasma bacterium]